MLIVALLQFLVVSLRYWLKHQLRKQFWGLIIFSMCRKTSVQNDYHTFPKCIVHQNIFCYPHTWIPALRSYCMSQSPRQRVQSSSQNPTTVTKFACSKCWWLLFSFFWSFLGSSEGAVHPACCRYKTPVFVGWFLVFGGGWWVSGVLVLQQHLSPVAVITETTDLSTYPGGFQNRSSKWKFLSLSRRNIS